MSQFTPPPNVTQEPKLPLGIPLEAKFRGNVSSFYKSEDRDETGEPIDGAFPIFARFHYIITDDRYEEAANQFVDSQILWLTRQPARQYEQHARAVGCPDPDNPWEPNDFEATPVMVTLGLVGERNRDGQTEERVRVTQVLARG
jgi:hypothetical protein